MEGQKVHRTDDPDRWQKNTATKKSVGRKDGKEARASDVERKTSNPTTSWGADGGRRESRARKRLESCANRQREATTRNLKPKLAINTYWNAAQVGVCTSSSF